MKVSAVVARTAVTVPHPITGRGTRVVEVRMSALVVRNKNHAWGLCPVLAGDHLHLCGDS
jgi:hypothetical protein